METKDVEIELDETDNNKEVEKSAKVESDLAYSIDDVPPWYLCILLGFQVSLLITL